MNLSLQELSVVIVDDNADNLFILADTIKEDLGVSRVEAVESGAALFALLASDPALAPDMILLDLQMPAEDGYVVLERLRQRDQLRSALVVAVTANVLPADLARCQEAGFSGFIGKPLSLERLPEQLQRILAGEAVWENH